VLLLQTIVPTTYIFTLSLHDALPIYHVLSQPDPYNYDYKQASVSVQVKVRDHFEQRTITQLSAQMRQDIVKRVKNNIVSLARLRSEEHTSELQSRENLVCRLLLEKKT